MTNGAQKFNSQFPRQILLTVIVVMLLVSYPLIAFASREIVYASIIGFVMSIVNVLLGYAAIEYSFDKSYTHFIQIVLGGIAIRLFLMAGTLLVLIGLVRVHALALVISLFGMYVIFLVIEVLYIHNKWQAKIQHL